MGKKKTLAIWIKCELKGFKDDESAAEFMQSSTSFLPEDWDNHVVDFGGEYISADALAAEREKVRKLRGAVEDYFETPLGGRDRLPKLLFQNPTWAKRREAMWDALAAVEEAMRERPEAGREPSK